MLLVWLGRSQWHAVAAAATTVAVDVLYLLIIWSEGEGKLTSGRVLFVSGSLACAVLALSWGLLLGPKGRAVLFTAGATLIGVWVVLGGFSVGLVLLPAAVLAGVAAGEAASVAGREAAVGALAAVALALAGIALT